jgi:putative mRNA 3-end processing factor
MRSTLRTYIVAESSIVTPALLVPDEIGLACALGGFHIDPWGSAEVAVITHAHADHARGGSGRYICSRLSRALLEARLPPEATIEPVEYGERFKLGGVTVSLHPAGHVLGAAQVRIESASEIWVASGDYKRTADPTTPPFEVVSCDCFITEATFAMPIFHWGPTEETTEEIVSWWEDNLAQGKPSVLFTYALGKAQRVMAELARHPRFPQLCGDRPIYTHGSVENLTQRYRSAGIALPITQLVNDTEKRRSFAGDLIIAPPSAAGSPWMRRFGSASNVDTGFASGWMQIRGIRRRRGYDRGFVLSDHCDWNDLLRTIKETGCRRVLTTHGYSDVLAKYLREQGLEAGTLATPYSTEAED